jgi:hypothetical protein
LILLFWKCLLSRKVLFKCFWSLAFIPSSLSFLFLSSFLFLPSFLPSFLLPFLSVLGIQFRPWTLCMLKQVLHP